MKFWGYSIVGDVEIDHRVFLVTITLEPANDLWGDNFATRWLSYILPGDFSICW